MEVINNNTISKKTALYLLFMAKYRVTFSLVLEIIG